MSPFFASYGFHPITSLSSLPSSISQSVLSHDLLADLRDIHVVLADNLKASIASMKRFYDRKVKAAPEFKVGDKVWLDKTRFKTERRSNKLDYKNLGPFVVRSCHKMTCTLVLPLDMKVHPTFHVSVLNGHRENTIKGRIQPPDPPVVIEEYVEYAVREILDSRIRRRKLQYLVDWEGYTAEHRQWEPAANVANARDLVANFHDRYPLRPSADLPPKPRKVRVPPAIVPAVPEVVAVIEDPVVVVEEGVRLEVDAAELGSGRIRRVPVALRDYAGY
jgi:hypothetical protein